MPSGSCCPWISSTDAGICSSIKQLLPHQQLLHCHRLVAEEVGAAVAQKIGSLLWLESDKSKVSYLIIINNHRSNFWVEIARVMAWNKGTGEISISKNM